jgi:hypothetical protein
MMHCHNCTALQCACIQTNNPSDQGVEDYTPMVSPLDSVVCSYLTGFRQQNCGTKTHKKSHQIHYRHLPIYSCRITAFCCPLSVHMIEI